MVAPTDNKSDNTYTDKHDDQAAPNANALPPDYFQITESDLPESSLQEPSGFTPSTSPPEEQAKTPSPFEPLTRPTNYLTIERQNASIWDTYSIDPSLPAPPGAVISKDKDGNNLNLRLFSTEFSVKATLDVIRGVDAKGPARMEACSKNGNVVVTVHDRQQNRFHLRSVSRDGSVTVYIPETFIGSVYCKLQNGRLTFGSRIHQHLITFAELKNESRHFIGDYVAHGYEGEETWQMDHLHLESQNGHVIVDFIPLPKVVSPEDSSSSKGKEKGFFSRFWGY